MNLFTSNTRKFTGKYAIKNATRFVDEERNAGRWWEVVESNLTRVLVMRRRHLDD